MIVIKIILGISNFIIGCLTFLWILEHYNLLERDQPYNMPFQLSDSSDAAKLADGSFF